MKTDRTLYLFTSSFPYATAESFLEDEIIFLAESFKQIVIIPFVNNKGVARCIPDNCKVIDVAIGKKKIPSFLKGVFHYKTAVLAFREFFRGRVYTSYSRVKSFASSVRFLNNCLYDNKIKGIIVEMVKDDVAYFYWGTGQNLLSVVLKGKVHLVSRFHGEWDLWEESYGGYMPFRSIIANSLDKAVFISKKGEEYFKKRYGKARTTVFPLGSKDYGQQINNPNDGLLRVVSCSMVYPLKRVPLIFEALNEMTDIKIEWTHIGGGTHYKELVEKVKKECKGHLKVNLIGMMSHDEVMEYYSNHHFDLFVNMSTSEGVPVSIMEAMSFDIPILATDVGATSEEVSSQVGELLPPNPTKYEIIQAIKKMLITKYTPRLFWKEHYNAEKNYTEFAKMLNTL